MELIRTFTRAAILLGVSFLTCGSVTFAGEICQIGLDPGLLDLGSVPRLKVVSVSNEQIVLKQVLRDQHTDVYWLPFSRFSEVKTSNPHADLAPNFLGESELPHVTALPNLNLIIQRTEMGSQRRVILKHIHSNIMVDYTYSHEDLRFTYGVSPHGDFTVVVRQDGSLQRTNMLTGAVKSIQISGATGRLMSKVQKLVQRDSSLVLINRVTVDDLGRVVAYSSHGQVAEFNQDLALSSLKTGTEFFGADLFTEISKQGPRIEWIALDQMRGRYLLQVSRWETLPANNWDRPRATRVEGKTRVLIDLSTRRSWSYHSMVDNFRLPEELGLPTEYANDRNNIPLSLSQNLFIDVQNEKDHPGTAVNMVDITQGQEMQRKYFGFDAAVSPSGNYILAKVKVHSSDVNVFKDRLKLFRAPSTEPIADFAVQDIIGADFNMDVYSHISDWTISDDGLSIAFVAVVGDSRGREQRLFFLRNEGGRFKLKDTRYLKPFNERTIHNQMYSLSFSPNSRYLILGHTIPSRDGIRIFSVLP